MADAFLTIRLPAPSSKEDAPSVETAVESPRSSCDPSDEVLMARISEARREALALLFRRYSRLIRGVAYRVLRDASEADDLLQDIFLLIYRLCRTFDSSRGSARSSGW